MKTLKNRFNRGFWFCELFQRGPCKAEGPLWHKQNRHRRFHSERPDVLQVTNCGGKMLKSILTVTKLLNCLV